MLLFKGQKSLRI